MKSLIASLLLTTMLLAGTALPAQAGDYKPDDHVVFTLSAENWVTTKTARVTLNIEAAVTGKTSGSMRATMTKAVNDVVKADWRLIAFSRNQDQTGMERWSALYEARVPENELNGLPEKAKKNSKAGMQITISNIDFSPTLEETQAVIGQTRTQIYKQAADQLAALNATLTGRAYRIAAIDFSGDNQAGGGYNRAKMARPMMTMANNRNVPEMDSAMPAMEKSEKITLHARVTLAAVAPTTPPSGK